MNGCNSGTLSTVLVRSCMVHAVRRNYTNLKTSLIDARNFSLGWTYRIRLWRELARLETSAACLGYRRGSAGGQKPPNQKLTVDGPGPTEVGGTSKMSYILLDSFDRPKDVNSVGFPPNWLSVSLWKSAIFQCVELVQIFLQ